MSLNYACEWRSILEGFAPATRGLVRNLVAQEHQALAQEFYAAMLEDSTASSFLSHEQVQSRLKPSMAQWLLDVFGQEPGDDLLAQAQRQMKIGEVHARIDVPVYLVLRGANRIKLGLLARLRTLPGLEVDAVLDASQLVGRVIDLTMQIMSQAYASSVDRNARSKEAYRLFSITHNISTLRERRRAELLEWQNQCLFHHALGQGAQSFPPLGGSDFGLWFRHKGLDVFQGLPEAAAISDSILHIDSVLLPALAHCSPPEVAQRLGALREATRHIAMCLEALFEHNSQMDAGRDALTHLLNRKFLPVVMAKEVAYARESGLVFSVLALDIDHFKRINDVYGHEGGDMVLQQVAAMLSNTSRGGDYLFRLGGEEFLMLLVDTGAEGALRVAEKLRQQVQRTSFQLPRNQSCSLTLSIGVATFDGHPDYHSLLRNSDAALYAAKAGGRNRVVISEDMARA